ncbi:MAG: aspartate kinase, partial [Gemmatimonadota bacterium]
MHKFGGASLADAAAIRHAASIITTALADAPPAVVVSAMAGVTDALLGMAARAGAGDHGAVRATAELLRDRHAEAARALLPAGRVRRELLGQIEAAFAELETLARGLGILRELSPRTTDVLVARGERLSARLFAAVLSAAGRPARYVDALEVVHCDSAFGRASPDLARTDRQARKVLQPLIDRGIVPVVPGFLGRTPDGQLATLGRGGSDLTATLIGRALGARRISLWKDVPGLLTADPRIVPDARVIRQLNIREAAELAYYGAKVLHPRALIPLVGKSIPLFVRPFADPSSPGTEISGRNVSSKHPVKALSAALGQALVTVEGNGMLGVPGIASRAFAALHHAGISVSLITQASSEHSICFSVPEAHARIARDHLTQAFADEIRRGEIDGIAVQPGVATIAVVGLGMQGTPGVAARVFSALAGGGINVVAIAQGSSELNISVVVDQADAGAGLRRIHGAFQLAKIGGGAVMRPERVDLVLLGFGQIGRTLTELLARLKRTPVALHVVGVIDRSGYLFDARGLTGRKLAALSGSKRKGTPIARVAGGTAATAEEAVAFMASHALSRPILVDVTADDTTAVLRRAVAAGFDVVLANKRPLSGPARDADDLRTMVEAHGRQLRHETTVGAGLPIIDTYYKLVESGDRVERIDGCLSGTLGFLLTEIGKGRKFSEALRKARAKGYTEPDPREDLSGMDVARKALILGRLLGYRGELATVTIESLVPAAAARWPLEEFLARLEEFDEDWARRVEAAR